MQFKNVIEFSRGDSGFAFCKFFFGSSFMTIFRLSLSHSFYLARPHWPQSQPESHAAAAVNERVVQFVFAQKCHHHRLTHKQACSTNKNFRMNFFSVRSFLPFCPYFLYLFLGSQIIALVVGKFFIFIRLLFSVVCSFSRCISLPLVTLYGSSNSHAPNLDRIFFCVLCARRVADGLMACTKKNLQFSWRMS